MLAKMQENGWAIARFWGQTHIFIDSALGDSLGVERMRQAVEETYTDNELEQFAHIITRHEQNGRKYYLLEVPPTLTFPGPDHPNWDRPPGVLERLGIDTSYLRGTKAKP